MPPLERHPISEKSPISCLFKVFSKVLLINLIQITLNFCFALFVLQNGVQVKKSKVLKHSTIAILSVLPASLVFPSLNIFIIEFLLSHFALPQL